jgi:hypothetical protein
MKTVRLGTSLSDRVIDLGWKYSVKITLSCNGRNISSVCGLIFDVQPEYVFIMLNIHSIEKLYKKKGKITMKVEYKRSLVLLGEYELENIEHCAEIWNQNKEEDWIIFKLEQQGLTLKPPQFLSTPLQLTQKFHVFVYPSNPPTPKYEKMFPNEHIFSVEVCCMYNKRSVLISNFMPIDTGVIVDPNGVIGGICCRHAKLPDDTYVIPTSSFPPRESS